MAIVLNVGDYSEFVAGPTQNYMLQWAVDLFSLATGLEDLPTDPREARIAERAIYQMAWFLESDHDDREELMSGFSGERIGSYSYNKMMSAVKTGGDTKVPAFDFAVEYFSAAKYADNFQVTSENVFQQGYHNQGWLS